MEMMAAVRYSVRPWPRGCFLSGALAASRVPMMVMTEDKASLRLFTASMTMATEWVKSPTAALNPARRRLARMPMTLVRMMVFSRMMEDSSFYTVSIQYTIIGRDW